MPYRYIGSTGMLNAGQIQNDIWLDGNNPVNPAPNDIRLIYQSAPFSLFVYAEQWNAVAGQWEVIDMPVNIVGNCPNLPPGAMIFGPLPTYIPINQTALNLGAVFQGFVFDWNELFRMRNAAGQLCYIRHMRRQQGQVALQPNPFAIPLAIDRIDWGVQINHWRGVAT